jgi:hypothetical protein
MRGGNEISLIEAPFYCSAVHRKSLSPRLRLSLTVVTSSPKQLDDPHDNRSKPNANPHDQTDQKPNSDSPED